MDSLMKYISRISRCAKFYRNHHLEKYGINGHQHIYIINVCESPGITQDKLANIIFVNKSNVARQIALLEQNGFVTRTPSETDRRQMYIYPTQKATYIYPSVVDVLDQWNSSLLQGFNKQEKTLLLSMMENITTRSADLIEETTERHKDKQ